jgi:hypothetical protein
MAFLIKVVVVVVVVAVVVGVMEGKAKVIPLFIGTTGTISKSFRQCLCNRWQDGGRCCFQFSFLPHIAEK